MPSIKRPLCLYDGTTEEVRNGDVVIGAGYQIQAASIDRLCPAFWANADASLNNENRIWACLWATPQHLYVIGGCKDDWTVTDTVLRAKWDAMTEWEQIGALPGARAAAAIFQDAAGDLFLLGGFDENWMMSHAIFRTIGRDFGRWEAVNGAEAPVVVAESATIGSNRYLIGGYDEYLQRTEVWRADAHDLTSWAVAGYLPMELVGQSMAVVGDTIYAIGGLSLDVVQRTVCSANINDLTTWTVHQNCLYQAVYDTNLVVIGRKAYLFGGYNANFAPCSTIQSVDISEIAGAWGVETDITEYDYGRVHFVVDSATKRLWRLGGEIYSSAVNMLYTPIETENIMVGNPPEIPAIMQTAGYESDYPTKEILGRSGAIIPAGASIVFENEVGGKGQWIKRRDIDGAIVLGDGDRRADGRIVTDNDLEELVFYSYKD